MTKKEKDPDMPDTETIDKRAKALAAMGSVKRVGDRFIVKSASLTGQSDPSEVWRNAEGHVVCSCSEFQEFIEKDEKFRCEHILAVKYSLVQQQPKAEPAKTEPAKIENPMTTEKVEIPYPDVWAEDGNPNLTYKQIKENLAVPIPESLISTVDRPGSPRYVNITHLKDLLDQRAGSWTLNYVSDKQVGNQYIIIVKLTIFDKLGHGYEQIGTGHESINVDSWGDTASNAYAQALRRAAESHGLSRELWRKAESNQPLRPAQQNSLPSNQSNIEEITNPIARSLSDLVTAKQLGMIRSMAKEKGIDADEECNSVLQCRTDELSKKAASAFIDHLKGLR